MATIKYTDRGINALRPKRTLTRYYDASGLVQGLHLAHTPAGRMSWSLSYKFNGQRKFHKLGTYPATSIKAARDKGRDAWELIEQGIDPNEPIAEPERVGTVSDLFNQYMADCERREVRTTEKVRRALEANVIKYIGSMPANEVASRDIFNCLKRISDRGSLGQCGLMRQYTRAMFEFGLKSPYNLKVDCSVNFGLVVNPVLAIPPVRGTIASDVYPTMADIACIWVECERYSRPSTVAALRAHIAAAGNRVHDTIERKWSDVQTVQGHKIMHIPRTKTGRPHSIVIGEHFQVALDALGQNHDSENYLFQGSASNGKTAITYRILSHIWQKVRNDFDLTADISPKTMRRAFKTLMGDEGISLEHRNIVQGHSNNSVAVRHYDRSEQLPLKLEVTAKWDQMLGDAISEYKRHKNQMKAVA
ncbi:hypothetical protein A3758_16500 [Oleiphilus sp. HI0118]|nr:hypothetical protein A3758_04190 [Oleiphilus sp. HI0118]KZZ53376.1 hypothetical protein A3758_16500 [Oleiphilus sp. HI0118]KZZ79194.1 hypothetical protein A3767_17205 [Oleiphilus sp. HI0133]KZZ80897.1 hypothetical protein A3767_09195 [Oleiphilus sp. HI0133]